MSNDKSRNDEVWRKKYLTRDAWERAELKKAYRKKKYRKLRAQREARALELRAKDQEQ